MTNDHDIRIGVHKIRIGHQERANKKKDKILKLLKTKSQQMSLICILN